MTPDATFPKDESLAGTLLKRAEGILKGGGGPHDRLMSLCKLLTGAVPYYDWVGFYLVDPSKPQELVLGPYVGAPTEHTRIPFGRGICGQAASTKRLFLVPDVTKEENYLSCSPDVRSEIVVPIMAEDMFLGELDIDSHLPDPFDDWDRTVLTRVCELVSEVLFRPLGR